MHEAWAPQAKTTKSGSTGALRGALVGGKEKILQKGPVSKAAGLVQGRAPNRCSSVQLVLRYVLTD